MTRSRPTARLAGPAPAAARPAGWPACAAPGAGWVDLEARPRDVAAAAAAWRDAGAATVHWVLATGLPDARAAWWAARPLREAARTLGWDAAAAVEPRTGRVHLAAAAGTLPDAALAAAVARKTAAAVQTLLAAHDGPPCPRCGGPTRPATVAVGAVACPGCGGAVPAAGIYLAHPLGADDPDGAGLGTDPVRGTPAAWVAGPHLAAALARLCNLEDRPGRPAAGWPCPFCGARPAAGRPVPEPPAVAMAAAFCRACRDVDGTDGVHHLTRRPAP